MLGDFVDIEKETIVKVYDRKSYFIRPSMANIDLVNIVVANPPKPDYYVLDKLIIACEKVGVEYVITVNKSDLTDTAVEEIRKNYDDVVKNIFFTSTVTGEGLEELKKFIKGKLCAFAGQSAVGKTSLINAILGTDYLTNGVSEKTKRGRHTTTYSQIIESSGYRVADTPGFSVIKADVNYEELGEYYPEFFKFSEKCRYRGCSHITEPDCMVKNAVESGLIYKDRYSRYVELYKKLKENRNEYD